MTGASHTPVSLPQPGHDPWVPAIDEVSSESPKYRTVKSIEARTGAPVGTGGAKPARTSLAAVFCRLARERFTGVVYAECADGGGVFSFRDGRAVFFEDVREGHSVADSLLAQGLITELQYADIGAEVLNAAAESEDVAFCQQAVRLGVLTRVRVDQELDRRVREHVVQAVGWLDCRVEVDPDPDSVVGILDYPQELGPLVHMGVRTFDADRVAALIPDHDPRFVRWVGADREAIAFFGLDARESKLVARLSGESSLGAIIDEAGPDGLQLRRLAGLLHMAGLIELDEERSADRARADRRGITRAAGGRSEPATGRYTASFVSEERLGVARGARPSSTRAAAAGSARPPARSAASSPRHPLAKEGAGPLHPLLRDEPSSPILPPRSPQRPPSRSASTSRPLPGATGASKSVPSESGDRLVSPPPRTVAEGSSRDWRPKRLGATLKRLDHELKHLRGAAHASVAPAAAVGTPAASPGRANLDQLMRMRQAALDRRNAASQETKAVATGTLDLFRAAQDALQKQKFDRAHELMARVCAAAPDNATYGLYHQWAAFRANRSTAEELNKLRTSLREKISDEQLKAFAYYALGHIALVDKKEEAAEKCFSKALELDKENKDAERHLRILELRRKAAESDKANNKFFGIEVGRKSQ
jgi:hypothetical protein